MNGEFRREELSVELLCAETFEVPRSDGTARLAPRDRAVQHKRTIGSMMHIEQKYSISQDYLLRVQSEIRPRMRRVLASWLLEVSLIPRGIFVNDLFR